MPGLSATSSGRFDREKEEDGLSLVVEAEGAAAAALDLPISPPEEVAELGTDVFCGCIFVCVYSHTLAQIHVLLTSLLFRTPAV